MTLRLVLGLLLTAAAVAVAGRRVWWLTRLVRTGQPAPGRLAGAPARLRAEVAEVFGQRKLLTWSVPGVAHFLTFWGFVILGLTILEAWGALFDRDFHLPLIGRWRLVGFARGLLRRRRAGRHRHVRGPADPQRAGPPAARVPLLRLAHPRGLGDPRDDLAGRRDAAALPGGAGQHRGLPVRRQSRWAFASWASGPAAGARSARTPTRCIEDGLPARQHRGDPRLPGDRRLLQAPAHRAGPDQRRDQAGAGRARRAAAGHRRQGRAGRLLRPGEPGRGPGLRPRQGRGLHLEGHARLRHLHRVRAVPVAVPGVEHRQAAVARSS